MAPTPGCTRASRGGDGAPRSGRASGQSSTTASSAGGRLPPPRRPCTRPMGWHQTAPRSPTSETIHVTRRTDLGTHLRVDHGSISGGNEENSFVRTVDMERVVDRFSALTLSQSHRGSEGGWRRPDERTTGQNGPPERSGHSPRSLSEPEAASQHLNPAQLRHGPPWRWPSVNPPPPRTPAPPTQEAPATTAQPPEDPAPDLPTTAATRTPRPRRPQSSSPRRSTGTTTRPPRRPS